MTYLRIRQPFLKTYLFMFLFLLLITNFVTASESELESDLIDIFSLFNENQNDEKESLIIDHPTLDRGDSLLIMPVDNISDDLYALTGCEQDIDFRKFKTPDTVLFPPCSYVLRMKAYGTEIMEFDAFTQSESYSVSGSEIFKLENVHCLFGEDRKKWEGVRLIKQRETGDILYAKGLEVKSDFVYARHELKGKVCFFRPDYFFATHYYDFMLYYLPSIYFLNQREPSMRFFVPNKLQLYEREALGIIGISDDRLIPIGSCCENGMLDVLSEEAYFTSFCNVFWKQGIDKEYYLEIFDFLKNTFLFPQLPQCISSLKRKIYIGRSDLISLKGENGIRSVQNEKELCHFLSLNGFDIMTLSGRSLYEQAKIFYESSVIIAPHGAGLLNIIFCQPGSKVLELMSRKWFSRAYIHLSALVGLEYGYVLGENIDEDEFNSQSNFYINLEDVKLFLDTL